MVQTNTVIEQYLQLKKEDISTLRFILEGYEGFATATTIDKNRAIVKLFVMPDFIDEVKTLISCLKAEMDIVEIADIPAGVDGGR